MTTNWPLLRKSRTLADVNGLTIVTDVYDPTVSPGYAADAPAVLQRTTEYQPKSIAKLNEILARWGAVASHAWRFQESASPALDMGASPVSLAGAGTPTFNVSTGEAEGPGLTDKGVSFDDNSSDRLEAANGSILDFAETFFVLGTLRHPAISAATTNFVGKGDADADWLVHTNRSGANGHLVLDLKGRNGQTAFIEIAVDHSGANYFDFIAPIDLADADLAALASSLDPGATVDVSALDSLSCPNGKLSVGQLVGIQNAAPFTISFLAIGHVIGSLIDDYVAALAAYTDARKAGAQTWAKDGAADTAWTKVGP